MKVAELVKYILNFGINQAETIQNNGHRMMYFTDLMLLIRSLSILITTTPSGKLLIQES